MRGATREVRWYPMRWGGWSSGCIVGGHAAPSANAQNEPNGHKKLAGLAQVRAGNRAPRDECVDSGLRWGRRRLSSAAAARTSLHKRERGTRNRDSVAG